MRLPRSFSRGLTALCRSQVCISVWEETSYKAFGISGECRQSVLDSIVGRELCGWEVSLEKVLLPIGTYGHPHYVRNTVWITFDCIHFEIHYKIPENTDLDSWHSSVPTWEQSSGTSWAPWGRVAFVITCITNVMKSGAPEKRNALIGAWENNFFNNPNLCCTDEVVKWIHVLSSSEQ